MMPADRRGPLSRIPPHEIQRFPAPGAVRFSQERWPEVQGEECQVEGQQETGQGEPDKDVKGGHILLYLLFWAEGTLCVIIGTAVFRGVRVFLLWPEKLEQDDTLDPFWMTVNALQKQFKIARMDLAPL